MKFHCFFFLLATCQAKSFETIEVDTTVGRIRGKIEDYISFLGVPYGWVDQKRPFEPADPYPSFNSTYDAFSSPEVCPQTQNGRPIGNIKCLNLNIYSPRIEPGVYLPVMIYIHGGQFKNGDGNQNTYNPRFLIQKNVIVVSINYRLGPFGFICLKNQFNNRYTNQGLKDQNLAIAWVKKNIKYFGGNENNILLFGHSAGAGSTDFHMLYDEQDLIQKFILQSGNAGSPGVMNASTPNEVFKDLSLNLENESEIFDIIQRFDNLSFGPCIDGEYITKTPKRQSFDNLEIILGGTDNEMLFYFPDKTENYFKNFDLTEYLYRAFGKMAANMTADIDNIKKSYGIDSNPMKVIDFLSDFIFAYPQERAIRYYLSKNATVRNYHFSYMGGRNYVTIRDNLTIDETTHGDELGYLFDIDILKSKCINSDDEKVIQAMTGLWTDFAKFGCLPTWPPTTTDNREYLLFKNVTPTMVKNIKDRFSVLDSLYTKYYQYYTLIDK